MSNRDDDKREYLRLAMVPSCAVDDSDVTSELLAYLVAFCSYASKRNDGKCWMAQEKVAKRMGVSRISVSKAAKRLAELGYMVVTEEWEGSTVEGKLGKQLTNTYWIDLNKTAIPPERDRSKQPRKRAGIGGRKPRNLLEPAVTPPVTAGVTPPVTAGVTQNLESEYGEGIRRGKRTREEACADTSPSQNHHDAEPDRDSEADPPQLRGAPPIVERLTRQQFMAQFREEYRARNGIEPRPSVQELAYNQYRHGLEPVR